MDMKLEDLIKLASALIGLAASVIRYLSATSERRGKKEDR